MLSNTLFSNRCRMLVFLCYNAVDESFLLYTDSVICRPIRSANTFSSFCVQVTLLFLYCICIYWHICSILLFTSLSSNDILLHYYVELKTQNSSWNENATRISYKSTNFILKFRWVRQRSPRLSGLQLASIFFRYNTETKQEAMTHKGSPPPKTFNTKTLLEIFWNNNRISLIEYNGK